MKFQYDLLRILDLLVDSVFKENHRVYGSHRNRLHCADDFSISVQMGRFNYCRPRVSGIPAARYYSAELGYPSENEDLIRDYSNDPGQDPRHSIYSLVPMEIVKEMFIAHGGLHPAEVIRLKKIEKQLAIKPNYTEGKRI